MSNRNVASPDDLIWEEPPASAMSKRYWSRWGLISAKLRERPGKWAKLPIDDQKNPRSLTATIKQGAVKAWRPKGAFDAVFTGTEVYARYVGEAAS